MKKVMIYTIAILLIIILTVGTTYAFFSAATSSFNKLNSETHKLEVIYTGDTEINGHLNLVKVKEDGYDRTISIGLSEDSVGAAANIYISIDEISSTIATQALKWEIYKVQNKTESLYNSGTFVDCGEIGATKTKCTAGNRIYMITDYTLSTTPSEFKVYIWLNGYQVGNEVLGATIKGYIGAETENISGILK